MVGILLLAVLGLSTVLSCPSGGMCEEKHTCCKSPSGGYGCCPLSNAECCSDHLHCCYEGTVCDLVHAKCINNTVSLPWLRRIPAEQTKLIFQGVKAVVCPDPETECPDDTTCCQLPDHSWGCCPLAKAVCCEDKLHCCPEGTKCDITHSKCSSLYESFPMVRKLPARRRKAEPVVSLSSVTCLDGKSSCPDTTTCCLLASGDYGCCPYPEAVCCSDHVHCCPADSTCDLKHEICKSGETEIPLVKKIPALLPKDLKCQDGESTCPEETTCCKMANGTYGCCPMPIAVCCSDQLHCCPVGTECDLVHSACVSAQGETETAIKLSVVMTATSMAPSTVGSVPCNESVACAEGNTCCKSSEGEWACCPLPKAVCCEDHKHCCPHGTICNMEASTCDDDSGNAVVPWVSKVPVFNHMISAVKCDKSTVCPSKSTCCKGPTGDWACCPLPKAVCCDDHIHCCPNKTVCNLQSKTCDDPLGSLPSLQWVAKVSAITMEEESDEKCDKETMCPKGSTCCKQSTGQWACCPLPQAVCCSDHAHCCPKGYECNVIEETCDKPGDLSLPWIQKLPALQTMLTRPAADAPWLAKNMCDPHTSCPKDTTCCFMNKVQKWGCCPLPKAVCCQDGDHCCPNGYTCEPLRSSCTKNHHAVPWYTKERALSLPAMLEDVKCDNKSSCASGTTCCELPTGEWGCCPLIKAVCCEDREHCCPQSYTCNMQTGTCEKKAEVVFMSKVLESRQRDVEEDVSCDVAGEYHCPQHETCCKTSNTEWACCPSPKAVCCADSKHCCPRGYMCDVSAGGCIQQTPPTWDTFLSHKKRDSTPLEL